MSVWDYYEKRKEEIHNKYPDLCNQCINIIENLWLIEHGMNKKIKLLTEEFPPVKTFNLTFFYRNMSYVISAYKLAEQGLVNPARNVTRTIYEQILRSILFLYYPDEAKLWHDYLKTNDALLLKEIRKRKYWNFHYMTSKLYKGNSYEQHHKFYEEISRYAHPHVRAAFDDIYRLRGIEDTMRGILGLTFNVIEVMQQTFSEYIDEDLNTLCEDTKIMIGSHLGEIILFRPNK